MYFYVSESIANADSKVKNGHEMWEKRSEGKSMLNTPRKDWVKNNFSPRSSWVSEKCKEKQRSKELNIGKKNRELEK